jgi:hypothetical protein
MLKLVLDIGSARALDTAVPSHMSYVGYGWNDFR